MHREPTNTCVTDVGLPRKSENQTISNRLDILRVNGCDLVFVFLPRLVIRRLSALWILETWKRPGTPVASSKKQCDLPAEAFASNRGHCSLRTSSLSGGMWWCLSLLLHLSIQCNAFILRLSLATAESPSVFIFGVPASEDQSLH